VTLCFEECAQDRQRQAFVLRLSHVIELGGKPSCFEIEQCHSPVLTNEAAQLPLRQFQFEHAPAWRSQIQSGG